MLIRCGTDEEAVIPDDPFVAVTDLDLHRALLAGADLSGRHFLRCSFRNATLVGARCNGVRFSSCVLALVEFEQASLVRARFTDCMLRHTCFDGANLESTEFDGVDLEGATFSGATFDRTLMKQIPVGADLRGARYTAETSWPDGWKPASAGMVPWVR